MAKAEKSLQEKFKAWFKGSKSIDAGALASKSVELELSADLLNAVSPEAANGSHRIKTITELTKVVRGRKVQEMGIELLWMKTKDLLDSSEAEKRHCALLFYEALIEAQYEQIDVMRAQFFRTLEAQAKKKLTGDLTLILRLLNALTMQGKKILHFDEKIGPFLYNVFPQACDCDYLSEFLQIVLNMIKFNPAYLDPEIVCGMIDIMGQICVANTDSAIIKLCLQCFYAIMGYSFIPKEALMSLLCTLCRVVNMKEHCSEAWRITGSLLQTHLSHSAMFQLCQITQMQEARQDVALVRGAIFFIGMGLWGSKALQTLQVYSVMTILPNFVQALECKHYLVTYEVALQLERLVLKCGKKLRAPDSDCALDLIEALLRVIPLHTDPKVQQEISSHVHQTIDKLESLAEEKRYHGSLHKLYHVIDLCSKQRSEASVIRLINYRSNELYPTKHDWIRNLHNLVEKYYKHESRIAIRMKTLDIMRNTILANRQLYEDDLMQRIAIPFLKNLDVEPSFEIRMAGIHVLTTLGAQCSLRDISTILEVMEKLLRRPLESETSHLSWSENDFPDVKATVDGLIKIFKARLCQPPASVIVRIFHILTVHLEKNYAHPNVFTKAGAVRLEIFQLFLAMRASESFHLGMFDEETKKHIYSPYIVCRELSQLRPGESTGVSVVMSNGVTYMSLTHACRLVIRSLSEERDWPVMQLILSRVPTVLQNKALITRYGKAILSFITPLIELTSRNTKYPDCLVNTPTNFSKSDFYNRVFPVLAAMASYSEFLDSSSQKSLINALRAGLLSKECYRVCIVALTACALEMKQGMYHLIQEVLLDFTKISATKHIATPMLEFLSTLIRLPDMFSSFTDTHYMYVFAIALPFTNPYRFDAYTMSLAHHVIVMWFLKCRLAYRQNFVQFIITGLNSYLRQSSESSPGFRQPAKSTAGSSAVVSAAASAAQKLNQESSQRGRSSSFSESALKARDLLTGRKDSNSQAQQQQSHISEEQKRLQKMNRFHQELTETCVDILARYMFANAAVQSKRLPTTKFLLKEGNSATWMLNTMLITITTSLCDQAAHRGGLCDRCHLICLKNTQPIETESPSTPVTPIGESGKEDPIFSQQQAESRKRHQSEFQVQRPSPSRYLPGASAKDDFDLRRQLSAEKLSGQSEANQEGTTASALSRVEKAMEELKGLETKKPDLCACWCNGWAEIYIRRLSGDVSWMCRIQNSSLVSDSHCEFPLADLTALLQPTKDVDVRAQMNPAKRIPVEERPIGTEISSISDATQQKQQAAGSESCTSIAENVEEAETNSGQFRRPSLQPSSSPTKAIPMPPKARPPSTDNSFPRRDRAHTISGPSPRKVPASGLLAKRTELHRSQPASSSNMISGNSGLERVERVTGISPQFVFLQLYHQSAFGDPKQVGRPYLVPSIDSLEASIRNLDRIPAHETHKFGVLYIGPGQESDETAILLNEFGSLRYMQFLHGLGSLISLKDIDKSCTYLGGLDVSDGDGDFAYIWEDDVMQVIYHVATLMPNNTKTDPKGNKKKRHIGNDFVAIVYNNSGGDYKLGTVKGQFIYACVVIIPLEEGSNKVFIECRPELDEPLGHVKEPKIVSERHLSVLVRQLALHCNLASQIQITLGSGRDPYSSNWLERLRQIKRIRTKVISYDETSESKKATVFNDFTGLVLKKAAAKKDE